MTDQSVVEQKEGAFLTSLKRNNSKIRADRAQSITEDAELFYKRKVEDIEMQIKKLEREQENRLDLSPSDAQSLTPAKDFNSLNFMNEDIQFGLKIRELRITLEIAKERYQYLFGSK